MVLSYINRVLPAAATLCALIPAVAGFGADTTSVDSVERLREVEVRAFAPRPGVLASVPEYTLSSETMLSSGVTDIADALHRLPGVNIRDYGGAGGMKTVSVRGLGATHTGLIYDGLPVSDSQNGYVDFSRYQPQNLQSLSLIVGDDNDIAGTATEAASAATVRMVSAAAAVLGGEKQSMLSAFVRAGSFGMVNPSFCAAKSIGVNSSASLAVDYMHAVNDYPFTLVNGTVTTRERRNNSRMNAVRSEADWAWEATAGVEASAKVYYYHNGRRLPGAVTLYNPESHERLLERNFFGQTLWKGRAGERVRWQAAAKFNWDASRYRDESPSYAGGKLDDRYYQRQAFASASALWSVNGHWSTSIAADYNYSALRSSRGYRSNPSRNSILTCVSGRYRGGPVLAIARLLLSHHDNSLGRDATRLSPSVSFSLRPWEERLLFLRLSYKNIFRMPTFADSYYGTTGSPELRPETTDQFNIGATFQCGRPGAMFSGVFTADAYYNIVQDRIVAIPRNMFIWSMVNVGKVRAIGVDITAGATVCITGNHSLSGALSYSYQRVAPRTDPSAADYNKQVAYTPEHSGSLSVTYENPWVNCVVHGTGVSERYGTKSNQPISRLKGYTEWGLGLFRKLQVGKCLLTFRVDLNNVFDTQYEIVSRYPMPGRAWDASVAIDI